MSEIVITKEDVSINPIEDALCEHCGENCTFTITHRVSVDFRSAGITEYVGGEYCETCAIEIANRIKESLPAYQ
jgi:hypothetical protein